MDEIEKVITIMSKVSIIRYIISLLVILLAALINKCLITKIFRMIFKITKKTKTFVDDSLIKALEIPSKMYIFLYSIYLSLKIINYDKLAVNKISSERLMKIFLVIVICSFLYNLTLDNSFLYKKMGKNNKCNTVAFPFLSIIIRIVIILIGGTCIAREFGFNGFIAGLGISGVAFALMAQDTFSNLFGGMVIVLDRPFEIGDWIQTSNIEGFVEEITFRSTKVRTFSMAIATVPNSKLANDNIINWTQRDLRRIHFKFTIKHETPIENIEKVLFKIEELLKNKEMVDDKLIIVSFNELSTYGFGIFIYFYTKELNYVRYEKLKQEINLDILKILREEEVELMFLVFNMRNSNEKREINFESECNELESIKNITEEERGK
ncbi:mechanosensitive ion channel family protein [Clostridium sp.]|uniref:mechanosensitive ion channel family protein n=1 Tax=Clostridium sp. TaxID=1506 RepID=UPI0026097CEF|nr:mechanosensitive ion channel family protein [Clostridium sp.]